MLYNEVLIHNQVKMQYSNNEFLLWLSFYLSSFSVLLTLTASLLPVFPFHGPSREEYLLLSLSHTPCLLGGSHSTPQLMFCLSTQCHRSPQAGQGRSHCPFKSLVPNRVSCTFSCWLSPDSPILPFLAQILEEAILQYYTATFASCRLSYVSH